MDVFVDAATARDLDAQLAALRRAQSLPFASLVADYTACRLDAREAGVRAAQLDKEAAELRDEARALATRLRAFDANAARDFATKAEAYRLDLARAQQELANAYRDKSKVSFGSG